DGHAFQGAGCGVGGVDVLRPLACTFFVDAHPGLDMRFEGVDEREVLFQSLAGRDLLAGDASGYLIRSGRHATSLDEVSRREPSINVLLDSRIQEENGRDSSDAKGCSWLRPRRRR